MASFLLTWNSDPGNWDNRDRDLRKIARGLPVRRFHWFTGVSRKIRKGDRVFLLKQGREPRGIVGAGWAEHESRIAEDGMRSTEVHCAMERLLDHEKQPILDVRKLRELGLERKYIASQASGVILPEDVARRIEGAWARLITARAQRMPPSDLLQMAGRTDDLDELANAVEGERSRRAVWIRKRVPRLRRQKLAQVRAKYGKIVCEVPGCAFDFKSRYGKDGERSAVVHHLKMVSTLERPKTTFLRDLKVVCANCHAMIHVGGGNLPLGKVILR